MNRRALKLLMLPALVFCGSGALAQSAMQFPDATETNPELIALYEDADSACRLSMSGDVKVAVACEARAIYGAALNERNWCKGREGQPNAMMEWHECGPDSLRFTAAQ